METVLLIYGFHSQAKVFRRKASAFCAQVLDIGCPTFGSISSSALKPAFWSKNSTALGLRPLRRCRLGIQTGADLRKKDLPFLVEHFGKSGPYFYGIARGIDERRVKPDRVRKSVGAEDTFAQDIHSYDPALEGVRPLIAKVWRYCQANAIRAKTVTLKVKYADFTQITRARTSERTLASAEEIEETIWLLLKPDFPPPKGVRLLGVTLSSLETADGHTTEQLQLTLQYAVRDRQPRPASILLRGTSQMLWVSQSNQSNIRAFSDIITYNIENIVASVRTTQ